MPLVAVVGAGNAAFCAALAASSGSLALSLLAYQPECV